MTSLLKLEICFALNPKSADRVGTLINSIIGRSPNTINWWGDGYTVEFVFTPNLTTTEKNALLTFYNTNANRWMILSYQVSDV